MDKLKTPLGKKVVKPTQQIKSKTPLGLSFNGIRVCEKSNFVKHIPEIFKISGMLLLKK